MVSPLKKQIGLLKKRKKSDGNKKNNKKSKIVSQKSKKINVKKVNAKKSTDGKKRKRRVDGNYTIKKNNKSPSSDNQKWKLYSMEGCPYCKSAKELLQSKKIDFDYIVFEDLQPEEQKKVESDIDSQKLAKIDSAQEYQNYKDNPFRTFPRIFKVNNEFIGGYNDTRLYFEKIKSQKALI